MSRHPQIRKQINKVERHYHLPHRTLSSDGAKATSCRVSEGVRVSTIRQILAMYIRDEYNLEFCRIARFLGFEEPSGAQKSIKAAEQHFKNKDYLFMEYYHVIMGLLCRFPESPKKGTQDFKTRAEEYIKTNSHKANVTLAAELGISINTVMDYRRLLNVYDDNKFEQKQKRPPSIYSNRNNIQQYFENL